MAWLSREIGRNHAYIQQYVRQHKPADLEFKDKVRISALLSIPLPDLGIEIPTGDPALGAANGRLPQLAEEAEPYDPPRGSYLSRAPEVAYFKARTASLDRHRLAIRAGDVVVVDIGTNALTGLASGDAVVVQLYDRDNLTRAVTVLRQFVEPHLLITNSSTDNSIISMDDESLPFEPVIKGKVVSVIRQS